MQAVALQIVLEGREIVGGDVPVDPRWSAVADVGSRSVVCERNLLVARAEAVPGQKLPIDQRREPIERLEFERDAGRLRVLIVELGVGLRRIHVAAVTVGAERDTHLRRLAQPPACAYGADAL